MTLSLRDLSLHSTLAPAPLLDGLSLEIPRGAVTGLCGGSGAGKSLIGAALIGQLPRGIRQSGTIDRGQGPCRIAIAPQSLEGLDPLARVGAQLRRFARFGDVAADPLALLAKVGLPATCAKLWPHQLSGGQARRVLLATALATGADYLIADEPTAGLDAPQALRIMALLRGFADRGQGVLIISHDLVSLAGVADRIAVLHQGRLVETAPGRAFSSKGQDLSEGYARDLWCAQAA